MAAPLKLRLAAALAYATVSLVLASEPTAASSAAQPTYDAPMYVYDSPVDVAQIPTTEPDDAVASVADPAGEAAGRGAYDIGPKATVSINGRTRILDGLTDRAVTEVKNVQSLSLTTQIRENIDYAAQTSRRLDLYVRPDTQLSGPLLEAISGSNGAIQLRFIPQ